MDEYILLRYFKGSATVDEEKQILDWVAASNENRKSYQKERMLYDIALFSSHKQQKQKKTPIIQLLKWSASIAAAAVLVISLGFFARDYRYNQMAQLQTVKVPAGQRAQITLADGTTVWLNSQSTLTYASNFGRKERNVELNGEAYFEVAKNKSIPFYVNTEKNRVKVVGTSFNVCAYNGTNEFETTLIEGVVDIYIAGNDKPITRLTKDEFFADYNGKHKKSVLSSYENLRWKEGLYCFDDSSFSYILARLGKYYNVEITVNNPKILDYRCTGKFKEQDGIEHILKVIQKDHKFNYTINERKDSINIQ